MTMQGLVQARVMMPGLEQMCQSGEICVTMDQCEEIQGMDKTGRLALLRQSQCGFSGSSPRLCCSLTSSASFLGEEFDLRTGTVEELFTEPSVTPVIQDLGPK